MHEGPSEGVLLDRQDANWESLNDEDLREAVRRIALECADENELRITLMEKLDLPWEQVEISRFPIKGNETPPDPASSPEERPVCFSNGQEINLGVINAQGRFVIIY